MGFYDNRRIDADLYDLFEEWLDNQNQFEFAVMATTKAKDAFKRYFAPKPQFNAPTLKKTYGKIVAANLKRVLADAGPDKPTISDVANHQAMVSCMATCIKDADNRVGKLFPKFLESAFCKKEMVREAKKHKLAEAAGLPAKANDDLAEATIAIKLYKSNDDVDKLIKAVEKKYKKTGFVQSQIAKINKQLAKKPKQLKSAN